MKNWKRRDQRIAECDSNSIRRSRSTMFTMISLVSPATTDLPGTGFKTRHRVRDKNEQQQRLVYSLQNTADEALHDDTLEELR